MEAMQIHPPTLLILMGLFFFMHWALSALVYKPLVASRLERNKVLVDLYAEARLKAKKARDWHDQYEQAHKEAVRAERKELEEAVAKLEQEAAAKLAAAQKASREKVDAVAAEIEASREAVASKAESESLALGEQIFVKLLHQNVEPDMVGALLTKGKGGLA